MPGWWNRFLKWRREVADDANEQTYIDVTPEEERNTMESQEEPRSGGWLARWRAPKKREQQLATLQQGFHELVQLTRSIREHMDQQSVTQKTLLDMLQHIPGAVEGLKSVGKATEQQTETLSLLKKQLESAARNEDHLVESMHNFNKTLSLMDDMSKSTSQTVTSMAERTRDSEDMLRTILERSEKRLVYMIVTLMIATLTVLGVGLYFGFGGRPASVMLEPLPPPAPSVEESFTHQKTITELDDQPVVEPPVLLPDESDSEPEVLPLVESEMESDAEPEVETGKPEDVKEDASDEEADDSSDDDQEAGDEEEVGEDQEPDTV